MEEVVRYQCLDPDLEIFVVQPGERLCIYGACSLVCLAGNATVNQYRLPCVSYSAENLVKVSAPQRMDIPAILQVSKSDCNYKHARLKYRLKEITPKAYETIMESIGNSQPAVLVFDKNVDKAEEAISGIIDNFHVYSPHQKLMIRPPKYNCYRMDLYLLENQSEKELNSSLDDLNILRKDGRKVSILPVGHKCAGKSNIVRNMVNRFLSGQLYGNIYVLDVDIGQSEFTPCGCLSLIKIGGPLLDKPFGHQRTRFADSYFYGDVTVTNFALYIDIFERLWNCFLENSEPGSVCIINTMGWLEDIGRDILLKINEVTKPNLRVFLSRDITDEKLELPILEATKHIDIVVNNVPPVAGAPLFKKLPSGFIRELTAIGYFSKTLPRSALSSIFDVVPYKIPFSLAHFCIPTELLVEDRMTLAEMNTQMVALCPNELEMKSRRLCGSDRLPLVSTIDTRTPAIKCIGFAIIRGISLDREEIYVISPIDMRELDEVPMFVRGVRIFTPGPIYTAQSFNQCPYVMNNSDGNQKMEDLLQAPTFTTGFKRSRNI